MDKQVKNGRTDKSFFFAHYLPPQYNPISCDRDTYRQLVVVIMISVLNMI